MLVKRDLGFTSPVFLVVVVLVPVILLLLRRKWRQSVARSEEVKRLLISASEESARFEFEAREAYYYTATATPSPRVSASSQTPTYTSVPSVSPSKPQYQCVVCFCPTTTRCAKCKAVRYCSGKCQIIHWRQGHKNECRPYVAVSPINDVVGSSYREGDPKDHSDTFVAEAKKSATPVERFPENSHYKDDDEEVEFLYLQQVTNATSESNPPMLYKGPFLFSTPTNFSASENFETVISAQGTSPSSAKKLADLGNNNQKRSNLNDEDTQSGTPSSSFWTDDSSNESSLSVPFPTSSGFWDGNIRKKKSAINEHDDSASGSFGEVANGYMANHIANGVSNNIMNGLRATEVTDRSGLTGLRSKKANDVTDSSKDIFNGDSGMSTHRDGSVGSDLFTSKFSESKNSPSGTASHRPGTAAVYSTFKYDKVFGGLPSGPEKSNFSNKITTPGMSRSREVVPPLSRASDTYLTPVACKHASHFTMPVKVDDNNHRVTTYSSHLTENSVSVGSGSKTSKVKVVDHLKNNKPSRLESSEGGSDATHRYSFKGLFPYDTFVKLYNWKQVELQPCGFKNCGNSCYANAVLQCLVYTPPLTAYLLEGLHSKACDKRGWCFTCELEGLVIKAKDGNSPLSPIRLLTHIENVGSNLGHGKEEDAHEFLRYVIEALQSVCIKEAGKYTLNALEEETTLIGLTFGGYLRSKVICMKCGGKSEQHERMMDLTVEIEGDIGTLEEALDKFTCTEILDGENKYKCSRCKSYEKAKKKLTLLEAPNVLTIALKRFQSGKFGKLNKSIHFPEFLDMAPYVRGTSDKSPIYRLYGVVVHVDTMNAAFSGHYVCYVKNFQNRWFKFDDSMVREVDLQHVLTKGAYMLLYARCSPRAPRSIRSSLIHHDPRKHKIPPSFVVSKPHSIEPWDACNYHPQLQVHHRSLEEESSSSSDNSGFFSESCSCSTESTTYRDSTTIEEHVSGDWEHDYHRNTSLNSSDSDTSSTSSFRSPSPLYSRLSHLYTARTNADVDQKVSKCCKVCRNLDCSCNSCRVTNLDRLGGPATNPTLKPSVTFRRSMTRGRSD